MPVKILCPNPECTASYTVPDESLGRVARCKQCGQEFPLVPGTRAAELSSLPDPDSFLSRNDPGGLGIPKKFGRYDVVRMLGQGGMGAVYLAHDTDLDRQVALKIPHLGAGENSEVRERFLREARAAARFQHPNFCPIHDIGQIAGIPYLSMAFIDGKTLSDLIETDRPWHPQKAAEIVKQLATALFEAHRQGVVHRDLKPANVMVNATGGVIIMDFGLARRFDSGDATFTAQGAVLGTPGYMPPEQAEGNSKAIGPHSDIYSLGVILYELLTGRRPFEGSAVRVLAQVLMSEPPIPSSRNPAVDRSLEAICRKAMAREIGHRYSSMNAFAEALQQWLAGRSGVGNPSSARPANPSGQVRVNPGSGQVRANPGSGQVRVNPDPRRNPAPTPAFTPRPQPASNPHQPRPMVPLPASSRRINSTPFVVTYCVSWAFFLLLCLL